MSPSVRRAVASVSAALSRSRMSLMVMAASFRCPSTPLLSKLATLPRSACRCSNIFTKLFCRALVPDDTCSGGACDGVTIGSFLVATLLTESAALLTESDCEVADHEAEAVEATITGRFGERLELLLPQSSA